MSGRNDHRPAWLIGCEEPGVGWKGNVQWGVSSFGEVGSAFARQIGTSLGWDVLVRDPLLNKEPLASQTLRRLSNSPMKVVHDLPTLVSDSEAVLSAVTPATAQRISAHVADIWQRWLFIDFIQFLR